MRDNKPATWCPECGPNVVVDEDHLCATCGSTASGPGADEALAALAALKRERALYGPLVLAARRAVSAAQDDDSSNWRAVPAEAVRALNVALFIGSDAKDDGVEEPDHA